MPSIVFEPYARVIVLLHAAAAIVLIGASTHHAIALYKELTGRPRARLRRIYGATALIAYAVTFVLGAVAYPAFRYKVRGLYLDRYAPWASNLFDLKEHLASVGLPLALGAFVLSVLVRSKDESAVMLPGYLVMVAGSLAIVWFNVVSGLLITLVRGM